MTPETLRYLREQRGLTREQLADFLGDVTASTVNKWERDMHAIPAWVEEKMLRTIEIVLPYAELHLLLDEARTSSLPASAIIADALRLWLAAQHEEKFTSPHAAPLLKSPACAPPAPSTVSSRGSAPPQEPANIVKLPPPPVVATLLHDIAAETTHTPPITEPRQVTTYPRRKRRNKKAAEP